MTRAEDGRPIYLRTCSGMDTAKEICGDKLGESLSMMQEAMTSPSELGTIDFRYDLVGSPVLLSASNKTYHVMQPPDWGEQATNFSSIGFPDDVSTGQIKSDNYSSVERSLFDDSVNDLDCHSLTTLYGHTLSTECVLEVSYPHLGNVKTEGNGSITLSDRPTPNSAETSKTFQLFSSDAARIEEEDALCNKEFEVFLESQMRHPCRQKSFDQEETELIRSDESLEFVSSKECINLEVFDNAYRNDLRNFFGLDELSNSNGAPESLQKHECSENSESVISVDLNSESVINSNVKSKHQSEILFSNKDTAMQANRIENRKYDDSRSSFEHKIVEKRPKNSFRIYQRDLFCPNPEFREMDKDDLALLETVNDNKVDKGFKHSENINKVIPEENEKREDEFLNQLQSYNIGIKEGKKKQATSDYKNKYPLRRIIPLRGCLKKQSPAKVNNIIECKTNRKLQTYFEKNVKRTLEGSSKNECDEADNVDNKQSKSKKKIGALKYISRKSAKSAKGSSNVNVKEEINVTQTNNSSRHHSVGSGGKIKKLFKKKYSKKRNKILSSVNTDLGATAGVTKQKTSNKHSYLLRSKRKGLKHDINDNEADVTPKVKGNKVRECKNNPKLDSTKSDFQTSLSDENYCRILTTNDECARILEVPTNGRVSSKLPEDSNNNAKDVHDKGDKADKKDKKCNSKIKQDNQVKNSKKDVDNEVNISDNRSRNIAATNNGITRLNAHPEVCYENKRLKEVKYMSKKSTEDPNTSPRPPFAKQNETRRVAKTFKDSARGLELPAQNKVDQSHSKPYTRSLPPLGGDTARDVSIRTSRCARGLLPSTKLAPVENEKFDIFGKTGINRGKLGLMRFVDRISTSYGETLNKGKAVNSKNISRWREHFYRSALSDNDDCQDNKSPINEDTSLERSGNSNLTNEEKQKDPIVVHTTHAKGDYELKGNSTITELKGLNNASKSIINCNSTFDLNTVAKRSNEKINEKDEVPGYSRGDNNLSENVQESSINKVDGNMGNVTKMTIDILPGYNYIKQGCLTKSLDHVNCQGDTEYDNLCLYNKSHSGDHCLNKDMPRSKSLVLPRIKTQEHEILDEMNSFHVSLKQCVNDKKSTDLKLPKMPLNKCPSIKDKHFELNSVSESKLSESNTKIISESFKTLDEREMLPCPGELKSNDGSDHSHQMVNEREMSPELRSLEKLKTRVDSDFSYQMEIEREQSQLEQSLRLRLLYAQSSQNCSNFEQNMANEREMSPALRSIEELKSRVDRDFTCKMVNEPQMSQQLGSFDKSKKQDDSEVSHKMANEMELLPKLHSPDVLERKDESDLSCKIANEREMSSELRSLNELKVKDDSDFSGDMANEREMSPKIRSPDGLKSKGDNDFSNEKANEREKSPELPSLDDLNTQADSHFKSTFKIAYFPDQTPPLDQSESHNTMRNVSTDYGANASKESSDNDQKSSRQSAKLYEYDNICKMTKSLSDSIKELNQECKVYTRGKGRKKAVNNKEKSDSLDCKKLDEQPDGDVCKDMQEACQNKIKTAMCDQTNNTDCVQEQNGGLEEHVDTCRDKPPNIPWDLIGMVDIKIPRKGQFSKVRRGRLSPIPEESEDDITDGGV